MADTRGTWSLSEAWAEKGAAEWVPIPNVWVVPAETRTDTCYWVAGVQNNTPTSNTVDKTNIPGNTSAQVPGLNNVMPGHWKGGHSSGTAGYSAGGREPQQSKIGKITYATDGGEILSTYLTAARGYVPIGFCNDTFGWFLGGGEPGSPWPVAVSKVDKMTFATEVVALLPGTQLHTALNNTTTSGNTTKGYYAGGQGPTSKIAKIEYSSDTNTLIPSTIPIAMYRGAGTTNGDGTIGYYIGGAVTPGMSYTSNCTKHVYATDTISDAANGKQYNPRGTNAGSGNQTYALSAGGYYYPGGLAYSSIDRMAYSNETSSRQPGLDMSTSRRRQGAHGARTYGRGQTYDGDDTRWIDDATITLDYGVFHGGKGPAGGSAIDKLDYTTETMQNVGNLGGSENVRTSSGGSSATKGYFLGGRNPAWPWSQGQSFVWKFVYSTSTTTYSGGSPTYLPARGYRGVGLDSSDATYATNWNSPTNWGYMYKVDHATDNPSYVPALNKSSPSDYTYSSMASSNISDGTAYIVGGADNSPSRLSTTEKVTFSNSTREKLPGSHYPINITSGTGVGGPTGGYFGTGYEHPAYTSTLYKLTNSTETFSSIGNLEGTGASNGWRNERKGALGGNLAGYFFGGYNDTYMGSNVDKFVYSTDTISNLPGIMPNPGQPDPYQRDIGAGSASVRANNRPNIADKPTATPTASTSTLRSIGSVPNTGYFGGGDPGNNSSVKRFNFSNETTSTIPATLSQARELTGGTSSITYGYFSGGRSPYYSITDRVTYSNDTVGRIPGANTVTNIADCMGSGVRSYGILGGGMSPTIRNYAQKLSFADETISNDGSLPEGRHAGAVVTEPETAAYFMAGTTPSGSDRSTVDKYTFSTSTGSAYPANTLFAKGYQTGMGSLTAGYVSGGPLGGGAGKTSVDKLTYSTSTWSTLSDTMSGGKYLCGGLNNTLFGVFCGGIPSSPGPDGGDTTQKVTFSTETVAKIPGANWADNWYRINGAGAQMNSAYATNPNVI